MIVITLRGEPQGKGRPRSRIAKGRDGNQFIAIYTPKETRTYEGALKLAARVAMGRRPPIDGPLEIVITAVMPIPKSWSRKKRDAAMAGVVRPTTVPDWDNFGKVCDALNEVVWLDDKQVVDGRVVKRYGEEPMMRIEVKPLEVFSEIAS